jgi:ADP-heptose:LPS heptosyltransferase
VARALAEQGRDLTVAAIRLGAMGDILRTIPPVRLLRRALPRARLVWVLEEQWRMLLDGHPDLDAVAAIPRRSIEKLLAVPSGWPRVPGALHRLRRELRGQRIDLALDFHGNLRSGLACGMTGAAVRLGYEGHQQKEGNHLFTTHRVPSGDRRTPRMERNLDLVRALGIADNPLPDGALPLVGRGAQKASEVMAGLDLDRRHFAVLSPGASRAQAYKKPPATLLAAACAVLAERGLEALVVFGPGEEQDARRAVEATEGSARLAPPTSLAALAALLSQAALFVGGDSGPLHMACAVGCPVLGIYGPTDPRVNRPWGVPCRALHPADRVYTGIKKIDREGGGFDGLAPETVRVETAALLDETAPLRDAR